MAGIRPSALGFGLILIFPAQLTIPSEVLRIAEVLEQAGYETWCVGGAVRDRLLGNPGKDVDLATAATPQQVRKLFRRTIPVGIEHGTVAVLDSENNPYEITTFRKDIKTDGRHAVVEFGVSLDEDLARRDFTINAIAYHPLKHEWRDLFNGAEDLDSEVVRAVGDPSQRFREDYLRILRALRFAARFGFEIERETWEAAKANVSGLRHLSAERVREEWFRGVEGAQSVGDLVALWIDVRAVEIWLPELMSEGLSVAQKDGLHEGGWEAGPKDEQNAEQVMEAIDRLEIRDSVLITSLLSADPTKTFKRLRCSRAEIERGARIGRNRYRWPDPDSDVEVRRWMVIAGESVADLLEVARIEGAVDALEGAVERVRDSGAPLSLGELAVTGDDLLAAGVEKGPAVGKTLRKMLDIVLEDPALNTRDALLDRIDD